VSFTSNGQLPFHSVLTGGYCRLTCVQIDNTWELNNPDRRPNTLQLPQQRRPISSLWMDPVVGSSVKPPSLADSAVVPGIKALSRLAEARQLRACSSIALQYSRGKGPVMERNESFGSTTTAQLQLSESRNAGPTNLLPVLMSRTTR